ncbi:hypothetical protein L950_0232175 [Sphingobacterium sp. IITKGP-BTPF85]|nr:hypothetical protein L950_0232175 [Sphingobacterium sp. IITKGP-BTPF85]
MKNALELIENWNLQLIKTINKLFYLNDSLKIKYINQNY